MPDFIRFVRQHIAPLTLSPEREQKIVDEWAAQLEDLYDALRAAGRSDEAAWREVQRQVIAGQAFGDFLLDGEPVLQRLAQVQRSPIARRSLSAAARGLRVALTSGVL